MQWSRDLGLGAIRQKLPIDLAAADHPRNGLIGDRGERLVDTMHHVDALGSKAPSRVSTILRRFLSGRPPGKLSRVLRPIMTGQPLVHATKWRMSARLDTTMSPSHPMPQSSHTATMAESLHVMSTTHTAMGMFLTCGPCS